MCEEFRGDQILQFRELGSVLSGDVDGRVILCSKNSFTRCREWYQNRVIRRDTKISPFFLENANDAKNSRSDTDISAKRILSVKEVFHDIRPDDGDFITIFFLLLCDKRTILHMTASHGFIIRTYALNRSIRILCPTRDLTFSGDDRCDLVDAGGIFQKVEFPLSEDIGIAQYIH